MQLLEGFGGNARNWRIADSGASWSLSNVGRRNVGRCVCFKGLVYAVVWLVLALGRYREVMRASLWLRLAVWPADNSISFATDGSFANSSGIRPSNQNPSISKTV